MSNLTTYSHPFKQGIMGILEQHFATEIVARFNLAFEAETFKKTESPHIWRQVKDDKLVLEVYYNTGATIEYVCDVYSWESRKKTEAHLLRYITDCIKAGKFGQNWEQNSTGRISEVVASGKLETIDDTPEVAA